MKTYGKEPESLESIVEVFVSDLASFPAGKVMEAIRTHSQRSQEFPTVFDIVNLIQRNGKPPLTESQYITISRKDGEERTPEEWQYLRDYEAERDGGWGYVQDEQKQSDIMQENIRLRKQILEQKAEIQRLGIMLNDVKREASVLLNKPVTLPERLQKTVDWLKEKGAPQEEIDAVIMQYSEAA